MIQRHKSKYTAKMRDKVSQCSRRIEKGNILIVVSFVGLFTMALSGGLINHYAVSEARGVADSLAKVRVYWAMVGHVDYALSRMRQEHPGPAGWTSDLGENNIQGALLNVLDELDFSPAADRNCRGTTVTSTANSKCSVWQYFEISKDYVFHFKWTVFDMANNDKGTSGPDQGNAVDGQLAIRIDYVLEGENDTAPNEPSSTIASLDNLSKRVLDLEYIVCFVEAGGPPIGNCQPPQSDDVPLDVDVSGASRVISVRRCEYNDNGTPGTFTGSSGSKTDNTETDTCI